MGEKPSVKEPSAPYRTSAERETISALANCFNSSDQPLEVRLDNFPKYIRRQRVTRYLALYELFKQVLNIKGSIIECGVNQGFGLMSWANFSAVLEPNNLTRRIYGFDTFGGFVNPSSNDANARYSPKAGDLAADSFEELQELIKIYDQNRFLGHVDKVHLIKGDVAETVPAFIRENGHLVVSLLFLDMDLYEPTKIALEHFLPRMPKGALLAFDELDNPIWPGETRALLDSIGINRFELKRMDFDPYISFAIL